MARSRLACLAAVLALAPPVVSQAASYTITRSIPLGTPDHWDYLSFDPASGDVLVAHGDHTDIVDPKAGRVVRRLQGLQEAHGTVAAPFGMIFADSGATGTVAVFSRARDTPINVIPAGKDADAEIYEPTHRLVVVMNDAPQTVTLIDTASETVRATLPLGGVPEFAAADGMGLIYVNLASTGQVAVLDVATNRVTRRFAVPGCVSPHGLAVDPKNGRLFVSCRNQKLVVLDAHHGTALQTLKIGAGTDTAVFDPVHHLVFSSNNDGSLSIFAESADGVLTAQAAQPTEAGARTMATDPASGRVFLVTGVATGPAVPGHYLTFKPGSVKLLVLDPVPS